ncbi:hypothetical protein HK405_004278 [Cladochytrium tenue]|nr:hypothetical protein HK405_004278 [Cladochytrium tenue]
MTAKESPSSASTPWWADRFLARRPSQSPATRSPEPLPPPTARSTNSRPDDGQSTMTGTSDAFTDYLGLEYSSTFIYGFLARNSSVVQSSGQEVTAVLTGTTNDEGDVDFYVELARETKLSELFPASFRIPDMEKDYLLAAGSLLVMELTASRGKAIVKSSGSGRSTSSSQASSPLAARRPALSPAGSGTTAVTRTSSTPNLPIGGSQATPDQSKVLRKLGFFSNWLGGKFSPKDATKPLPRLEDSDTILLVYGGEYNPIDRRVDRLRNDAGLSIKVIPIWAPLKELRRWEANEHHLQVNSKIDELRGEIRGVHSAVEDIRLMLAASMRPTTPNNGDAAPGAASAIGPSSSIVPASGVGPAAPPPSSPLSSLQPYTSVMPGFGTWPAPPFFSFVHPTTAAAHPHQPVVPNMMHFLPGSSVPMFSNQPAGSVPLASSPSGYSFEAPAGALPASGRPASAHRYSFEGGGGFGGAGETYHVSDAQHQPQQQSDRLASLPRGGGGGYFYSVDGSMMTTLGQPGPGLPAPPVTPFFMTSTPPPNTASFWVPQPQPHQSAALRTTSFSLESSAQFYGVQQPAGDAYSLDGFSGATQTAAGSGATSFQVGARGTDSAPSFSSSTGRNGIRFGTRQQHQQLPRQQQ